MGRVRVVGLSSGQREVPLELPLDRRASRVEASGATPVKGLDHDPAQHGCRDGALLVDAEIRTTPDAGSSVTRLQVGAGSEILNVGRARRAVPAALRKALMLRDRHCQFPDCGRPARWADAHHIKHWIDGDRNCLSNLILVFRRPDPCPAA